MKWGSVSLQIYPWKHSSGEMHFRFAWHDDNGKRCHTTSKLLPAAKAKALARCKIISKGHLDLNSLPPDKIRLIRRLLDAGIDEKLTTDFLSWKAKAYPMKLLSEAVEEFIAAKKAMNSKSPHNVRNYEYALLPLPKILPGLFLPEVTTAALNVYLARKKKGTDEPLAPKSVENIRNSLITFFLWCRNQKFLPDEGTVADETVEPIVVRKAPLTWEPEEMAKMLMSVRPDFLPWLATAAFAGVRTEEICPDPQSKKSQLQWGDFYWDQNKIEIRPEVSKTGDKRIIPIPPALRDWLFPVKGTGPICLKRPDDKDAWKPETTRLGKLVGGWRRNALRHSFISYRACQVGLGRAALEAGNSEQEAKRSYNDAKSPADAESWFSLDRRTCENLLHKSL